MSASVALIGCGKTKAPMACLACDIYTGQLFRAAYTHALRTADRVYILSAKHGLLRPTELIQPYNLKLTDLNKREREAWGSQTAGALVHQMKGMKYEVTFYAGEAYVRPVAATLMRRKYSPTLQTIPCHEPLRGLQVGQRLAWFKERRGEG